MSNLSNLKNYLKGQSALIRSTKNNLKNYQKEHCGNDDGLFFTLKRLSQGYRHHHIAYSLLKGLSYESIEKPNENNKPNMSIVQEIQNAYISEDVCAGKM